MHRKLTLPPTVNLIDEIASLLPGRDTDYSSCLVVFPGRRPAHFLRRALARRLRRSFIPPRIYSMDDFIDFLYEEVLGITWRKISSIDAIASLYEIHRDIAVPLGADAFVSADTFFPLGDRLFRDLEELLIESIPPQRVKEIEHYTEERMPPKAIEKLQSLSFLYEKFYQKLEDRKLSTRSSRYRTVSARIETGAFQATEQLVVAGFSALTEAEKGLFRKLSGREETLFVFQDGTGLRETLQEIGFSLDRDETGSSSNRPAVRRFYESPDTHGQVFALSRLLKEERTGQDKKPHVTPSLDNTAIVLPSSETLFPLLHHCLCLFDETEYNITMGYPLARTPVCGFFNCLIELVSSMDEDRLYLPAYLAFVLHPYTKNIYFPPLPSATGQMPAKRSDITRIIFHAMEEKLRKHRQGVFLTIREIEDDDRIMDTIAARLNEIDIPVEKGDVRRHLRAIHESTIERFLSFRDIADCAQKSMEILTYVYENSTARLHPFFHPFAETLLHALGSATRSDFGRMSFENRSGYFHFLRRYMRTCSMPFEGTPLRGLQVMGLLETRNLQFRRVFILDMNEGILPDARREDSLLPLQARKILGIPTHRDRESLIAATFDLLVGGADEVHLFSIDNDRKQKSRFVEELLWEEQKSSLQSRPLEGTTLEDRLRGEGLIQSIEYSVNLENLPPRAIAKTDEVLSFLKECTYTATSLDDYLRCPLRFYHGHVLDLRRRETSAAVIEQHEIGGLVHLILATYFRKRRNVILTEEMLQTAEMEKVVDDCCETVFGDEPGGRIYLIKRQVRHRMGDFINRYYRPRIKTEHVIVRDTEHPIEIRWHAFHLKGILDAIEGRGTRIFVIDYKTSSSDANVKIDFQALRDADRQDWPDCIGSLQLPLYLLLYRERYRVEIDHLEGLYLLLGKTRVGGDMEWSFFDGTGDKEERLALFEFILFSLLNEISDPSIPFTPTAHPGDDCPGCPFQDLCGTRWTQLR